MLIQKYVYCFGILTLFEQAPVVEAAIAVASQLFKMPSGINTDSLLNALVNLSKPENELVDARREALLVLKNLAKSDHKVHI